MQPIKHPLARCGVYLVLTLFFLYSIIPFVWATLQSFKTVLQANARTPLFFFPPTWENYRQLWLQSVPANGAALGGLLAAVVVLLFLLGIFAEYIPVPRWTVYVGILAVTFVLLWLIPRLVQTAEFYDYFVNTLVVTVGTVLVSISIGCLAGYGLARYIGIAAVVILVIALAFRALPRMAFVLPYYWLGQRSGLYDTYLLVIISLVAVNQPFTIWMLRGFFMDIPREIEEAATVDGASRFGAFWKVIIPIMWPGIVSTALFTVLLAYNEFLLVRVLTQSRWTLPVAIAQFTGGEDPGYITLAAAASVSATIPIVLVILFFQKQLVKGLAAGAVKG
jgi:ABC-type glycerol-3-phosphate transport system permease component